MRTPCYCPRIIITPRHRTSTPCPTITTSIPLHTNTTSITLCTHHTLPASQHMSTNVSPLLTSHGTGPGCLSPRGPAHDLGSLSRCPVHCSKHPLQTTTDRRTFAPLTFHPTHTHLTHQHRSTRYRRHTPLPSTDAPPKPTLRVSLVKEGFHVLLLTAVTQQGFTAYTHSQGDQYSDLRTLALTVLVCATAQGSRRTQQQPLLPNTLPAPPQQPHSTMSVKFASPTLGAHY